VVHLNPKNWKKRRKFSIKDYLPIKSQLQNNHKVIGVDVWEMYEQDNKQMMLDLTQWTQEC
jgi:hypothetical protein